MSHLSLLVLALADPLPGPLEDPPPPIDELPYVEAVSLPNELATFSLGMSISAGAWSFDDRWIANATFALDAVADFGRFQLSLSPHATAFTYQALTGLFGFQGQLALHVAEYLWVSVGTDQVVEVSRWQTGAIRVGPSVKPIIVRVDHHHVSLQMTWLALGFNERRYAACEPCNERPPPYYALGYGYLF